VFLPTYVTKQATRAAFLVALLVPALALAQNNVAFRAGPGPQMTCGPTAPTAVSTRAVLWCKSTDSNKLHYQPPGGADAAVGGGASITWPLANGTSTNTFNYAGTFVGSSTGYSYSSTNAPSGLGDDFVTWAPGGTKRGSLKYNPGTDNFQIVSPTTFFDVFDNASSGLRIHSGVDTELMSAGVAVLTCTQASCIGSGSNTNGTSGTPWPETYSKRYSSPMQTVAAAASLTIGPINGNGIRITLSATAITSLTVNSGLPNEQLRIEVIQDATGSRTIPTTWTNVSFAGGTYTATATASKRDIITLFYDSVAARWYEASRAMNL
jgi:hypothetical protein